MDNEIINITAFKKAENSDDYIIRLFNPTEEKQKAVLSFKNNKTIVDFGAFEIKTFKCNNSEITVTQLLEDII